jgi:hypothetical protein
MYIVTYNLFDTNACFIVSSLDKIPKKIAEIVNCEDYDFHYRIEEIEVGKEDEFCLDDIINIKSIYKISEEIPEDVKKEIFKESYENALSIYSKTIFEEEEQNRRYEEEQYELLKKKLGK